MKDRLRNLWESLRGSLWLVPTVMMLLSATLALAALKADVTWQQSDHGTLKLPWWVFTGSADAARQIMSTIAGSMMTVTALVFSMTMVTLTLASQQYGPRLLRNFISDPGNKVVLGTFIATFIYCIMILRSIRGEGFNEFIPQIAVTVGIVLAFVSLMVLIYFIHHIASSIQIYTVVDRVGDELEDIIRRLYPSQDKPVESERDKLGALVSRIVEDGLELPALKSGYLQTVDYSALQAVAERHNFAIRMSHHAGNYIIQPSTIVTVFPVPSNRLEEITHDINEAFILGKRRTPTQDVEFAVDALVEIALRALSPSLNDPFTAVSCIDRLSEGLLLLGQRAEPSPYLFDRKGVLRIIKVSVRFEDVIDRAFHQIRQSGAQMPAITIHMLDTIARISQSITRQDVLDALARHARLIGKASQTHAPTPADREAVEQVYRKTMASLALAASQQPITSESPASPAPRARH